MCFGYACGSVALRFDCAIVRAVTTLARDKLLSTIEEPLALSKTELGRLFGVSRQAIDGWHRHGVPPERLPGIARRRARAYGGLTALEMIEQDRHEELLDITRRSFDWASTA